MFWAWPHQISVTDVLEVAATAQAMLALCILTYSLKMQNSPLEAWEIADKQYNDLKMIARMAGEALRTVGCLLRRKKDIVRSVHVLLCY